MAAVLVAALAAAMMAAMAAWWEPASHGAATCHHFIPLPPSPLHYSSLAAGPATAAAGPAAGPATAAGSTAAAAGNFAAAGNSAASTAADGTFAAAGDAAGSAAAADKAAAVGNIDAARNGDGAGISPCFGDSFLSKETSGRIFLLTKLFSPYSTFLAGPARRVEFPPSDIDSLYQQQAIEKMPGGTLYFTAT